MHKSVIWLISKPVDGFLWDIVYLISLVKILEVEKNEFEFVKKRKNLVSTYVKSAIMCIDRHLITLTLEMTILFFDVARLH